MTTKTTLVTLLCGLFALSAHAGTGLAGKTFQIDVLQIGRSGFESSCMSFHEDGRLAFGNNATMMTWRQPYGAPDEFVAVSQAVTPAQQPINLGTHGLLISGDVLVGTTIDAHGNSTAFLGSQVERCVAGRPAPTPSSDCLSSAQTQNGDARRALAICATVPYLNSTAQPMTPPATCTNGACDTQVSDLANRSFIVVMNHDIRSSPCWAFDARGELYAKGVANMVWKPDYLQHTRRAFQAVSRGGHYPATFYGVLLDREILDVRGIIDQEGGARVAYGVGFEVHSCSN